MIRRFLVLLLCLPAMGAGCLGAARVVAVGDVHGEIDGFDSLLQTAALTDPEGRWIGGDATLVQTGDLTDRGVEVRAVMDRLRSLEQQAPTQGGRVVALLGNHEVSNLTHLFDTASTPIEVYRQIWAGFADDGSKRRQRAALRQWWRWQRQYPGCVKQENKEWIEDADTWLEAHPPGYVEYLAALAPDGEYGSWLRGLDVVAEVDGTLFLHGGISPELVERSFRSVEAINDAAREALATFDKDRHHLVREQIVLPFSDLWEIHCAIFVEMARLENDGRVRAMARRAELAELNSRLPGMPGWFPNEEYGPLWYRGLATAEEASLAPHLDAILAAFDVSRIAVGHTPQPGKIRSRFGGRVFLLDTAMAYAELGGRAAALEIDGDRITALYPGKRVPMPNHATGSDPGEAGSESRGEPVEGTNGHDTEAVEGTNGHGAEPLEGTNGHGAEPVEGTNGHDTEPVEGTNGHGTETVESSNGHGAEPVEGTNGHDTEAQEVPGAGPSAGQELSEGSPDEPERTEPVWLGADGEPLPFTRVEEVLEFLAEAKITDTTGIDTGVTEPTKLLLERDGVRAHAIFHNVDVEKRRERLRNGKVINFFRDHYKNNIAAFELSRLLGMSNVPPVVERRVGIEDGSVQLWIENSMTEADRRQQQLEPTGTWRLRSKDMKVFDNLINNIDRNQGNILYDGDWNLWFIDHTRTFGRMKQLPSAERITRCSRDLLQAIRDLDEDEVTERLKPYLGIYEIRGVMKRRDSIVKLIEERIGDLGEMAVLFNYSDLQAASSAGEPDVPEAPPEPDSPEPR